MMRNAVSHFVLRVAERLGLGHLLALKPEVTIGRKRMTLAVAGHTGVYSVGQHEAWLLAVMERLLAASPGAMVDVGVNTGQTLMKFLALEADRRYIGFDPNVSALAHAELLAELNGAQNVTLLPLALSERGGLASFQMSDRHDQAGSLVEGFRDESFYRGARWVATMAGDDVLEAMGVDDISVLKVDVEGGELEVMRGMARTIAHSRPAVLCEILPIDRPDPEIRAMRLERAQALVEFFRERDFVFHQVYHDGRIERLDHVVVHDDMTRIDHLFLPRERLSDH